MVTPAHADMSRDTAPGTGSENRKNTSAASVASTLGEKMSFSRRAPPRVFSLRRQTP